MRKFVIVTDSCSDLNKELRARFDIDYLQMRVIYDGVDMPASLDWEWMSPKEFYDKMRRGTRFTTSQVIAIEYQEAFEKYVNSGFDVLSISCSSALSGSFRASEIARDEVLASHPEAKIICVDSLRSCLGLGVLCIAASEMRAEGKTIEEVAEWLNAHKLNLHQYGTCDDLVYLRRAGRVSATSAVFGGLLKIKPIIISDAIGQNVANEKVRGRQAALKRLLEHLSKEFKQHDYQKIAISHADCLEEAELFRDNLKTVLPDENIEIYFDVMGPIIGASCGPGTIILYFYGDEVTYKA